MAATLEQRRKQRFQFLRSLYEMSRGSERVLFYIEEVGDTVGLGVLEAENAAQYLAEKRLIRVVMKQIISISQAGSDELEAALEQPDQPTTHFPPAQSIPTKPVTPPPAIAVETSPIPEPPIPVAPIQMARIPELRIPELRIPEPPIQAASIQAASIQAASIQAASIQPLPSHIVENDSDELASAELRRICEAIGLDPQEINGELAAHRNRPLPEPVYERDPAPLHALPMHEEPIHEPPIDEPPLLFRNADLDVILESLGQQLPKLGLAPDELEMVQAENDTARAQLASPKPKRGTLAASLRTLLSILENAGPLFASDTRENLIAIRDFQERISPKTISRSASPRKRSRVKALP